MYERFFNLILPPFHNTPNARFFYETAHHREALAKLEYTVRHRRGFALITGEIGSGKTTLTRTLLRKLGTKTTRACIINNTRVSPEQLLRMIAAEFGLDLPANADKGEILIAMRRFAEQAYRQDHHVVIIIDEGQCLSIDEFEEIRLLTNLENETDKLVQLLILGQPELRDVLSHPRLKPLTQRIAMYSHLGPMGFEDTVKYIAHRLVRAAKQRPNVDFSREALRLIYERSGGVPRVVNLLCDNSLLVAYARNTRLIDSRIVRRAAAQLLPAQGEEAAFLAHGDASETMAPVPTRNGAARPSQALTEPALEATLDDEVEVEAEEDELVQAELEDTGRF